MTGLGLNPDLHDKRPANNGLSHGMALRVRISDFVIECSFHPLYQYYMISIYCWRYS